MRFQPPPLQPLPLTVNSLVDQVARRMLPRRLLLFSLATCGLFTLVIAAAAEERQPPALYVPRPEDFRDAYDADASNKSRQSWDEYYGWVEAFYRGNLLARGWTTQAKHLTEAVDDRQAREEIIVLSNALGRQISQEWSKDNSVRRINSDDLTTFGRQLKQAAIDDDGSGSALSDALKRIEKAVQAALKPSN